MSIPYYGDFAVGSTVRIPVHTFDKDDGSSITMTGNAVTDVEVFKNGGTTERASDNGYTFTVDFDTRTGLHMVVIDTSDNSDSGFFAAGNEYEVAIDSVTVDAVTVRFWIGTFSIERSGGALATLKSATYGLSAINDVLTAMKGSGFLTEHDSLTAIRDRGDAAWTTGSGAAAQNAYTLTWTRTVGDNDGGSSSDATTVNATYFSTGETTGTTLLEVDGVATATVETENPSALQLWAYYASASTTHHIIVKAYNYIDAVYEPLGTIAPSTEVALHTFNLSPQHIDRTTNPGEMKIKCIHSSATGNIAHAFHIDKALITTTNAITSLSAAEIADEVMNSSARTMYLKSIRVINDSGTAVLYESTGGNGDGISIKGIGMGRGARIQAQGLYAVGLGVEGGSNGIAVSFGGVGTTGKGLVVSGGDQGDAMILTGGVVYGKGLNITGTGGQPAVAITGDTDNLTLQLNSKLLQKLIWDEVISPSQHNVKNSAAYKLWRHADTMIHTGIAQGPGSLGVHNQIQLDTGASSVNGAYDPALVVIVAGTGAGQSRNILQYEGATRLATVDRGWRVDPDATSEFIIVTDAGREHVNEGLAQGGGAETITLNANASPFDDAYNAQVIFLRSGAGEDQARRILDYNGTTKEAIVSRPWATVPDSTTAYVVLPTGAISDNCIGRAVWSDQIGDYTGIVGSGAEALAAARDNAADAASNAALGQQTIAEGLFALFQGCKDWGVINSASFTGDFQSGGYIGLYYTEALGSGGGTEIGSFDDTKTWTTNPGYDSANSKNAILRVDGGNISVAGVFSVTYTSLLDKQQHTWSVRLPAVTDFDECWNVLPDGRLRPCDSGAMTHTFNNEPLIQDMQDAGVGGGGATPQEVWEHPDRTLTSFGSLVSDIVTAVWSAGTRTLSSFESLVSDIWGYVTRTLTSGGGGATVQDMINGGIATESKQKQIYRKNLVGFLPIASGITEIVWDGDPWTDGSGIELIPNKLVDDGQGGWNASWPNAMFRVIAVNGVPTVDIGYDPGVYDPPVDMWNDVLGLCSIGSPPPPAGRLILRGTGSIGNNRNQVIINLTGGVMECSLVNLEGDQMYESGVIMNMSDNVSTGGGATNETIQDLTEAIGNLAAGSLVPGTMTNPYEAESDQPLVLFKATDNDDITFTVGPQWSTYLQEADAQVWFTVKGTSRDTTALIDAQATVDDPVAGVIKLSLTAAQTTIKEGTFGWQLQVRRSVTSGNPPVTRVYRRMLMEGKVYVKPLYKV